MTSVRSHREPGDPAPGEPEKTPTGPYLDRASLMGRNGWTRYSAVTAVGIAGLIGLLVASHFAPSWAEGLRLAALGWFIVCGVLRITVFRRR